MIFSKTCAKLKTGLNELCLTENILFSTAIVGISCKPYLSRFRTLFCFMDLNHIHYKMDPFCKMYIVLGGIPIHTKHHVHKKTCLLNKRNLSVVMDSEQLISLGVFGGAF